MPQPKTATLTINGISGGSLSMELQIRLTDNRQLIGTKVCSLPPLPAQLSNAYQDWRKHYLSCADKLERSIVLPSAPIETNSSLQDYAIYRDILIREFNNWLASCNDLSHLREEMIAKIIPDDYQDQPSLISIILQTRTSDSALNIDLQKLPWHEWKFIHDRYPNVGINLSTDIAPINPKSSEKLKALVICGNYKSQEHKINIDPDLASLKQHLSRHVELEIWTPQSDNNSKLDLIKKLRNETYHLLFFCGHSSSNNQIQLNDIEHINIDDPQFKMILKNLKNRGLILAFFNSCDGLGIARSLMAVGIPYVMVMKEIVHDLVAQKFIDKFLKCAVEEKVSIHVAADRARKELFLEQSGYALDGDLLPALFQNPEQPSLYLNSNLNTRKWKFFHPVEKKIMFLFLFLLALIISLTVKMVWPPEYTSICRFANDRDNFSCGEKILLNLPGSQPSDNKVKGFRLIKTGLTNPADYSEAIELLTSDWEKTHDPETLVAIENAKIALLESKNLNVVVKNIVIVVPAKTTTPSYISDSFIKGVAYAQLKQNKKNNTEWKLRVIIADDGNNIKEAEKIAKQIVERKDILGVIGHYSSYVTIPIVKKLKIYDGKVVLVSPTATSHELSRNSDTNFFFRVVPQSKVSAKDIVNKWVNPKRRMIVFYQNKDFSISLTKGFKDEIKAIYPKEKLIVREVELSKISNIKDEIEQAKRLNVNSIVLFPDAYTGDKNTNSSSKEIIKENKGEMPIMTNTSIYDSYDSISQEKSTIIKPELYKNIVISVPWSYSNSPKHSQKLIPKEDPKSLPEIPTWWLDDNQTIDTLNERVAMSYEAASVFVKAFDKLARIQTSESDERLKIQEIISDPDFMVKDSITGNISFNGSDRKEEMNSLIVPNCDDQKCSGFKPYVKINK